MKPATSLPWESSRRDDKRGNWTTCDIGQAVNYGGRIVARALGPTETDNANAAYIAHSANAYPRLVEALNDAIEEMRDPHRGPSGNNPAINRALDVLRELGEL